MLEIIKINSDRAQEVLEIQQQAFRGLLQKYQDYDTNPAMESQERIVKKMDRPYTDTYLITHEGIKAGSVRISNIKEGVYKVSSLGIIPIFQNRGLAQFALHRIEERYPAAKQWVLATIKEEQKNCYLYEKLGYVRNQEAHIINEKMTIVGYEKFK
ncbi:MAG: GNAT family N-acetyltransferase [Cellulosilyticaceae bacterium]